MGETYIIPFTWIPERPSRFAEQFSMGAKTLLQQEISQNIPPIYAEFIVNNDKVNIQAKCLEDPIIMPPLYVTKSPKLRINEQSLIFSFNNLCKTEAHGQLTIEDANKNIAITKIIELKQGLQKVSINAPMLNENEYSLFWNDDPLYFVEEISLNHIKKKQYAINPAKFKQIYLDIDKTQALKIAFIYSSSLALLNITQKLCDDIDIFTSKKIIQLQPELYDVIILDSCIRATYHKKIDMMMPMINQWVLGGGKLISLYQRPQDDPQKLMPWIGHFTIGSPSIRWRETDPNAPIIMQNIPLFNLPNTITQDDWHGWSQERGLYFISDYQKPYQSALRIQKGNNHFDGSLIYGQFGQGTHIHCGLALERQMRISHKGAIKLWMNMLTRP